MELRVARRLRSDPVDEQGAPIQRFARIRYRGFDLDGVPIEREADGFHARVVQHECDHLIGKLYPMRIRDFSRFGFTSVMFPTLDPEAEE